MGENEEYAKAVQDLSKLGIKGIEAIEKLGSFFSKVFKAPIEEISGMLHDRLRFFRWKCLVKIVDESNEILDKKGITETRAVPPKIALPIFEEASLEDDPTLQALWSHLLANAMNPEFNDEIRYGFIGMIKNITAIEVNVLNLLYQRLPNKFLIDGPEIETHALTKYDIMVLLDIKSDVCSIAINNLMRMQLIEYKLIRHKPVVSDNDRTSYTATMHVDLYADLFNITDNLVLTPLGVKFVEACTQ